VPESRLFLKIIQLGSGGDIPIDVVSEALIIREQLGDRWGEWIPVTVPNGSKGVEAMYRPGSELVEYLCIRYPVNESGGQRYDGFQLTRTEPPTATRWESVEMTPIARSMLF